MYVVCEVGETRIKYFLPCIPFNMCMRETKKKKIQVNLTALSTFPLEPLAAGVVSPTATVLPDVHTKLDESNIFQAASKDETNPLCSFGKIYVAAAKEFNEEQLSGQGIKADVFSNMVKSKTKLAEKVAIQYEKALRWMLPQATCDVVTLCSLHKVLTEGGLTPEGTSGVLRKVKVKAGSTHFPPPELVPGSLQQFCDVLTSTVVSHMTERAPQKAAWAMFWLLAIHPFKDGNGRMARILMNWVLSQCNVPFVCYVCASPEQREAYISASKAGHDPYLGGIHVMVAVVGAALARGFREVTRLAGQKHQTHTDSSAATVVSRWRQDSRDNGTCVVCLDDRPNMATLCCGTLAHIECMRSALLLPGSRCPHCREVLPAPPPPPAPPAPPRARDVRASLATIAAALGLPDHLGVERTEESSEDTDETTTEQADEGEETMEGEAEGNDDDETTEEQPVNERRRPREESSTTDSTESVPVPQRRRVISSDSTTEETDNEDANGDSVDNNGGDNDSTTESNEHDAEEYADDGKCRGGCANNKRAQGCSKNMCGACCRRRGGHCPRH